MSALNFAFAVACIVLVVLALVPRFRSRPWARPPWRLTVLAIGLALVFRLLDALVDR